MVRNTRKILQAFLILLRICKVSIISVSLRLATKLCLKDKQYFRHLLKIMVAIYHNSFCPCYNSSLIIYCLEKLIANLGILNQYMSRSSKKEKKKPNSLVIATSFKKRRNLIKKCYSWVSTPNPEYIYICWESL